MHFTGKERDAESGLDNFGARYDASSMGRFMTPDPLGGHQEDPQTLNKYAYVRNNPVTLTDPSGLDFYLQCTDKNHNGCTQVQIDPKNKGKTWVQADKNGNATIVTSDSIREGKNSATVDKNGVEINGKSNGIYFDNPASHTSDAKGNDVNHNPITLTGNAQEGLGGFAFNVNGNCGGTCFASGAFSFSGTNQEAEAALRGAGSWDYGTWDVLNSTEYGHHPYTDQFRFGSGPSLHVSVPWDFIVAGRWVEKNPNSTVPSTGGWHVDSSTGTSHALCANVPGVSCN
jgi:RHS repeat-associated protein